MLGFLESEDFTNLKLDGSWSDSFQVVFTVLFMGWMFGYLHANVMMRYQLINVLGFDTTYLYQVLDSLVITVCNLYNHIELGMVLSAMLSSVEVLKLQLSVTACTTCQHLRLSSD